MGKSIFSTCEQAIVVAASWLGGNIDTIRSGVVLAVKLVIAAAVLRICAVVSEIDACVVSEIFMSQVADSPAIGMRMMEGATFSFYLEGFYLWFVRGGVLAVALALAVAASKTISRPWFEAYGAGALVTLAKVSSLMFIASAIAPAVFSLRYADELGGAYVLLAIIVIVAGLAAIVEFAKALGGAWTVAGERPFLFVMAALALSFVVEIVSLLLVCIVAGILAAVVFVIGVFLLVVVGMVVANSSMR